MSKLIKNTFIIFSLSFLMVFFAYYRWHSLKEYQLSNILIVFVGFGLVGSFLELFVIKLGDLIKRDFYPVNSQSIHSDIYKMVEILSVRLALNTSPKIEIFSDEKAIIKITYQHFNQPIILISTKCIESYTTKELEFALALKIASIKNGNDSALKIYRGFVGIFFMYPAAIVKSIIDIEQSKKGLPASYFSKIVYIFIAVVLSLSGGFFAQLLLLLIEYVFDWYNYQLALVITKNKIFHLRHMQSEKLFSEIKLKFYALLDQFYFGIQAILNR